MKRELFYILLVANIILLIVVVFCLLKPAKTITVQKVDTLYIYDTLYLSSTFWFSAKRCDSVLISSQTNLQKGLFFSYSQNFQNSQNKRWGLGVGLSYQYPSNLTYFILGEYVLRDYFRLGGYINPQKREVGVYGKVEF